MWRLPSISRAAPTKCVISVGTENSLLGECWCLHRSSKLMWQWSFLSRSNMNTTAALELAHGRSTKQSCLLATKLTLLVAVTESGKNPEGFFWEKMRFSWLQSWERYSLDLLCWLRISRKKTAVYLRKNEALRAHATEEMTENRKAGC